MDAQKIQNEIDTYRRNAEIKRSEAQKYLQSAASHSGANQPDQAMNDQEQANKASQEAMDFEQKIQTLQTQLTALQSQALELDKREQSLRQELSQIEQKKNGLLGGNNSTPFI